MSSSSHIQRPRAARLLRIVAWTAFGMAVLIVLVVLCAALLSPTVTIVETSNGVITLSTFKRLPMGAGLVNGIFSLSLLTWVLLLIVAKRVELAARS
jgi:hypothetical protein